MCEHDKTTYAALKPGDVWHFEGYCEDPGKNGWWVCLLSGVKFKSFEFPAMVCVAWGSEISSELSLAHGNMSDKSVIRLVPDV